MCINVDPTDDGGYQIRAHALEQLGKKQAAREAANKAKEVRAARGDVLVLAAVWAGPRPSRFTRGWSSCAADGMRRRRMPPRPPLSLPPLFIGEAPSAASSKAEPRPSMRSSTPSPAGTCECER